MTTWQPGQLVADERMAELMAAHHMRTLGHRDALPTPVGADGGIDVTSRGAIAQVKYRAQITGRPDLQKLVGAREHDLTVELWFFSSSKYSAQAMEYADRLNIRLLTFDARGALHAHNDLARRALAPRPAPAPQAVTRHAERRATTRAADRVPIRLEPHRSPLEHLKRNVLGIAAGFFYLSTLVVGANARDLAAQAPAWGLLFVATGTAGVLLSILYALQLTRRRR